VEDETGRRLGTGHGNDAVAVFTGHENAPAPERGLELREGPPRALGTLVRDREELDGGPGKPLAACSVGRGRCEHRSRAVEEDGSLDLRRNLGQIGEGSRGIHRRDDTAGVRRPLSQPLTKFYADRGPHLAAMIAYFGLLSSVSLIFLALALLGYTGRAEESSYLVKELQRLFPSQGINDIVRVVQAITSNATTLGVIGSVFLLWTSLSLFSVLESAFNIVYRRPNRSFLRGKFLASLFMAGSVIVLVAALFVGSVGYDLLKRFAPEVVGNGIVAYAVSVLISTVAVFVFLVAAYERLTNVYLTLREVWPGAALAAVLLQVTFQALPLFVRFSSEVIAVRALGASVLLLVWLYVMANVIIFGAEINWWLARRDEEAIVGLA
jgi:membrane protein